MVKAYSRYTESGSAGRIHSESVGQTVLWSEDGRSMFSCVGTSVVEINAKTGAIVGSVSCSGDADLDEGLHTSALSIKQPCRATSISRAGSDMLAIGCSDGSTRVVRLPLSDSSVDQVGLFQGHRGYVNALSFNQDGSYLVTGGRDTEIVLWDLVSGSGVCRLKGHKGEVTSLVFLDSSFVASGSKDGLVKIWSIKLQICVQTLTVAKSEIWSLFWDQSLKRLILGSSDKSLYVYRLDKSENELIVTGEGLVVAEFHGGLNRPEPADGRVVGLCCLNGLLLAQTDRRVVEMWRVVSDDTEISKRSKKRQKKSSGEPSESGPSACDEFVILPSPENAAVPLRYVATGRVKTMAVTSVSSGLSVALGLGDNQIESFCVAQKKTGKNSSWQLVTARGIVREGHRSGVHAIAVSPQRMVSVSSEAILVWGVINMSFQRRVESPSGDVLGAFFLPGSSDMLVLVTKDGHVCVLDLNTGSVVGEVVELFPGDDGAQVKCAVMETVSAEDVQKTVLVMGCAPSRVIVIDVVGGVVGGAVTLSVVNSFSVPDEPVSIALSPKTGKYIAVGLLNCNIDLLFADSGKHALALYAHKLPVTSLAFSPDEQVLCSGSVDKNIKVWSIKFGNVLKSIRAHDNAVTCLKFIPHSHLLWSGARDGVVSLWDIDRFERVMSKVVHPSSEVLCVAASRDAGMVFTGGLDRFVQRLTRGEDQMFIEEETEKAMEIEIDGEARREDLAVGMVDTPTKSSLHSVRLVEKVVEMIEIDEAALENDKKLIQEKKIELVKFVASGIPPADLQQVVVSLPTGHARRLLAVIAEVLEIIRENKKYPAGFPIESCVSTALFLIQAQAKYLIGEPHSRQVLLKLKELFHQAVSEEIENFGIASASIRFMQ